MLLHLSIPASLSSCGVWQERWPALQTQSFKHFGIFVDRVVGGGQESVPCEDAVRACHESHCLHRKTNASILIIFLDTLIQKIFL